MTRNRVNSHQLAISSQANPAQSVLSALRGRRQNRHLLRGGKL